MNTKNERKKEELSEAGDSSLCHSSESSEGEEENDKKTKEENEGRKR